MTIIGKDIDGVVQPPSTFLPSIKRFRTTSKEELLKFLSILRYLYIPQVRGSTRRRRVRPAKEGDDYYTLFSAETYTNRGVADKIRADSFERAYVIQWLTCLISLLGSESADDTPIDHNGVGILEDAASLLAVCAGTAACGAVTRTFEFPLNIVGNNINNTSLDYEDNEKIAVILRDVPLESFDPASVGAQTWGGSCILAEMIAENPSDFGLYPRKQIVGQDTFRALELGAGTGLASLVLAKVMERIRPLSPQQLEGQPDMVVATDFHPSVIANLRFNYEANFPDHSDDPYLQKEPDGTTTTPRVFVVPLDWATVHSSSQPRHNSISNPQLILPSALDRCAADRETSNQNVHSPEANSGATYSPPPPLKQPFDLIIGADIIYEHSHARWIRSCVERFLKKPPGIIQKNSLTSFPTLKSSPTDAIFHLIIPLRRTHSIESRSVEDVFAEYADVILARRQAGNGIACSIPPAPELVILSKEDISCDAYSDLDEIEEVIYRYYRIGWM